MSDLSLLAFCGAAAGLAVVPGPTIAVIIANTLRGGMRAGLFNTLGAQAGIGLWLALAGWGMEAVLHHLGLWFDLLRYAAAAYMIWLALRLLAANGRLAARAAAPAAARKSAAGLGLQGFVVTLTNPKMIMVFGVLIPSFLTGAAPAGREGLTLGLIFATLAALSDIGYLLVAARARDWFSRGHIRGIERTSAVFLILAGSWMALHGVV